MRRSMPIDVSFCIQCNWRCKFMTFFRILTHEYVIFFREVTFIFRKVLFFHATHHAYIDGHFLITNAGLCPCITWDNEAIGRYMPWRKNFYQRRTKSINAK